MTVRENLIPDDMPYGERQAQREALGAAGLPSETGIPAAANPVTAVTDVTGAAAAPEGDPSAGGDLFDQLEPSMGLSMPPPTDPQARLRTVRDTTLNEFLRAILDAILGDRSPLSSGVPDPGIRSFGQFAVGIDPWTGGVAQGMAEYEPNANWVRDYQKGTPFERMPSA